MIDRGRWLLSLAVLVLAPLALPSSVQAQDGRITGVVQDVAGEEISGATVVARNRATGDSETTITAEDGRYTISGLAEGTYEVYATLAGRRQASPTVVRLGAGESATVDLTIQPLRMDDISVTAMLREQEMEDVPFSIAAPTADVLRRRGAQDIEAIAANVPGLTIQNLGPGQSKPAIRGASSGQIARDQPGVKEQVSVYLDDVPISLSLYTPDLDLFDVSRVEVLRGPQGTLFGSGSLAGTVRYITNEPELGVRSSFGQFGSEIIDGGGPGANLKLGRNQPLGDKAALRVVAYHKQIPGFMDAVQPDLSVDEDVNDGSRSGGRAALLIQPSEELSITPRLTFQRVDMDGWNRIDDYNILANPFTTTRPAVDLGERELFIQFEEPYTDEFLLADLNITYDLGGVELSSITAYTNRDILVVRDATALTASITGGSLELPEEVYTLDAPLDDVTDSEVWTQEVRLSGEHGQLEWLVGGFYSNNKRDYGQSLLVEGFEELTGIPTEGLRASKDELFFSDLGYELEQVALFGEGTVGVTDQLDFTAGLRFYRFEESREQVFDGIFTNDETGTDVVSVPGDTESDGIAPRFIASYEVSDDVTLNAQASKGFRLGGINDPLNVPLCTPEDLETFGGRETWEDETVWNYEVGAKSRLFDGLASLNVSAFFMDINDLQVTVTAGSCSSRLVFNVPEARSRGFEAEFTATPSEHLDVSVSAGYNDAELQSTVTSTSAEGDVSVVSGIESGARLPSVPRFQAALSATVGGPILEDAWASFTGSYQHVGSRITEVGDHRASVGTVDLTSFPQTIGGPLTQETFTFDPVLPAYDLFNARFVVERGHWQIALFGNNLTDERAFLALDRERGRRARVGYLTNPPRTIGLELRFAY